MSTERQARAQHAPGNARKLRATQMRKRSSHGLKSEQLAYGTLKPKKQA